MSKRLLDLYRSMLAVGNLYADSNGHISAVVSDKKEPVLVKGKSLVLPTDEQLAVPNWENRVAFNPLQESIMRDESAVVEVFRQKINVRLNWTCAILTFELMRIAASPGEHAKLNPDQSEFLSRVKNTDEKTLKTMEALMGAMPFDNPLRSWVSIFLKKGGILRGVKHSRVGIVSFPLWEELSQVEVKDGKTKYKTDNVFGVSVRVKDRDTLRELVKYIFPQVDKPEAYNCASDSKIAPFVEALMHTVQTVAGPINDVIELFRNQLSDPDKLLIPADWVEAFNSLETYEDDIRSIPMLPGNEGAGARVIARNAAAAAAPTAAPVAAPAPQASAPSTAAPAVQPWQPPQPQSTSMFAPGNAPTASLPLTERGLNFDAYLRNQGGGGGQPAFGAQPQQWGAPPPGPYSMNPRPAFGQPSYAGGWGGQPQPNAWGQPQQVWGQPTQQQWGQPQSAWGQPMVSPRL